VVGLAAAVLVACGGLVVLGGGLLVKNALAPCTPPANEERLIAAYLAEPLLAADAPAASVLPRRVYRSCDVRPAVEHQHPVGHSEVDQRYLVTRWRTAPQLLAADGGRAVAEGWAAVPARNDDRVAAVQFCRSVEGVPSTLTIAVLHDGAGFVEVRQVTSLPAHASCPFQEDVWVGSGVPAVTGTPGATCGRKGP